MNYDNMYGWSALVYLGVSAWFWRGSSYLDSNARIAWALFWPVLSLVLALVVLIDIAVALVHRLNRHLDR